MSEAAPIPANEQERLQALARYDILDTPAEPTFDRITAVAKVLFGVPLAWISFVDAKRQWFKSSIGLDACETDRGDAFCAHAILSDDVMVVPDALHDPRFADNPFVSGPPKLRFYAGAPLKTTAGFNIGTLCVGDASARPAPDSMQIQALADLAALVVDELELRLAGLASARLASVVESSVDAIVGKDLDGTITSWNPAAEALYGYPAEEAVGRHISMLVPGGRRDEVSWILDRIRRGESVSDHKTTLVTKFGQSLTVVLTVSPIRDRWGNVVGASTIGHDITERERADELLRRQAESLRELGELMELTHDAIIVRDVEGRVSFWNAGAERRYGWPSEQAVGRISHELLQTEFPLPLEEIEAVLARDGRWEGELVHSARDGRRIDVASRWALRPRAEGRGEAVLEINNDVTDQKRAQREMLAAKEEAERATRAKSEFLANMSHEIRTPMNGVIGMTDLLLDTDLDAEQRDYAETVRGSADALLTIINDILDFSKIEAGRMELEEIDFVLSTVVEEVADLLAERAERKGLETIVDLSPALPRTVRGDPGRLRQILINLVGNAIKFTEAGEVVVRVRPAAPGGQSTVRFEVQDTGVGIDPETKQRLFRSFSQGDVSTTRRYGGTGLGLAICRQLTELMGGEIGLESEPGRGSTFWFAVRLEPSPQVPTLVTRYRLGEANARARGHLLVVEDNAVNQRVASRMLEKLGYRVDVAANGVEAVDAVSRIPYAAVLMDCHMPEMDGYEATRRIRQLGGDRSRVPVIAMTAGAMREDEEACLAAGMDDFLTKPVDVGSLAATLGRYLRAEASPQAVGPSPAPEPLGAPEPSAEAPETLQLHGTVLAALRDSEGQEFFEEVATLFVDTAQERIGQLVQALGAGDIPAAAMAAHTLRGSSAEIGATAMADLCRRIESAAGDDDVSGAAEAVPLLEAGLEQVRAALVALTGAGGAPG